MKQVLRAAIGAAALALACGASAQEKKPETPRSLAGAKVVSAEEAARLAQSKSAQFFDTRSAVNFGKGHVPGAKATPYMEKSDFAAAFDASQDRFDLGQLPSDKATPIVFYSDGPTGWKSYKAAVLAVRAGYKSVHYFRDGWAEWERRKLPVAR